MSPWEELVKMPTALVPVAVASSCPPVTVMLALMALALVLLAVAVSLPPLRVTVLALRATPL